MKFGVVQVVRAGCVRHTPPERLPRGRRNRQDGNSSAVRLRPTEERRTTRTTNFWHWCPGECGAGKRGRLQRVFGPRVSEVHRGAKEGYARPAADTSSNPDTTPNHRRADVIPSVRSVPRGRMSTRPSPCTPNDNDGAAPVGDARSATTRSPRPRGPSCTSLDAPPGDARQPARLDEHDDEVTEAAVSALVLDGFADKMRMREQLLVYDAAYRPPVRGSRLYHRRTAVIRRLSQCVARWAVRDEITWVAVAYYDRICYEMGEAVWRTPDANRHYGFACLALACEVLEAPAVALAVLLSDGDAERLAQLWKTKHALRRHLSWREDLVTPHAWIRLQRHWPRHVQVLAVGMVTLSLFDPAWSTVLPSQTAMAALTAASLVFGEDAARYEALGASTSGRRAASAPERPRPAMARPNGARGTSSRGVPTAAEPELVRRMLVEFYQRSFPAGEPRGGVDMVGMWSSSSSSSMSTPGSSSSPSPELLSAPPSSSATAAAAAATAAMMMQGAGEAAAAADSPRPSGADRSAARSALASTGH